MGPNQNFTLRSSDTDLELVDTDIWSYVQPIFSKKTNKTALICNKTDRHFTYKNYMDLSLRWAVKLQELDLKKPTVSICTSFCVENVFLFYGTLAVGGSVCALMNQYPEELIGTILTKSGTDVLIIEKKMEEVMERQKKRLGLDFMIMFLEDLKVECLNIDHEQPDPSSMFKPQKINPNDPAFIFFSSGTTGPPKAIVHCHKNFLNASIAIAARPEFGKITDDRDVYHVSSTPLAHISGVLIVIMIPVLLGDCAVIEYRPEFSVAKELIKKYQTEMFFMRPFHLHNFVDDPETPALFKKIKYIGTGGLAPDPNIQKKLHDIAPHVQFIDVYGSTEMIIISMTPVSSEFMTPGTVPLRHVEIQVRDFNTGVPLGPNKIGEVFISSVNKMIGYLNDDQATKDAYDEDGWFKIGDLGYHTEDGQLVTTDRVADKIIVAGKTVIPSKVEKILVSHPAVKEAYIIGIPDIEKQQIPRAFVLTPEDNVTTQELIEYVNARVDIPEEKLEGGLEFKDFFLKTSLGKVSRKHLREFVWSGKE